MKIGPIIGYKQYPEFDVNNKDYIFRFKDKDYRTIKDAFENNYYYVDEDKRPELMFDIMYSRTNQSITLKRKLTTTFGKIDFEDNDVYWNYWKNRILTRIRDILSKD